MADKITKPAPTQQYLNIAKIKDGIVIMKDGRLRLIMRAMPINFDLKNDAEKEATVYQFQSVLNALKFPIQIVLQSRRIDLSAYISKIEKIVSNETNELIQGQGADYLEFIKVLGEEINIMEKSFYVIVGHTARGAVEKEGLVDKILKRKSASPSNIAEEEFKDYKNILAEKARVVSGRLAALGVNSQILESKEIIELFYNSYNPEEAITEHLAETEKITSDLISKESNQALEAAGSKESVKQMNEERQEAAAAPKAVEAQKEIAVSEPKTLKKTDINGILSKFGINSDADSPEKVFQKGLADVLDIISPAGLNITPNYIQLGSFYVKTLFVFTYPRYLQANWLSSLINTDNAFDLSIFIYPSETSFALGQLHKKTTQLQSSLIVEQEKNLVRNPELETAVEDVEELRDTLQKGETKLFQTSMYVTLYSQNADELNKLSKQVEAMLGGSLTYTKQAFFQMEQGFNSTLPLMDDELNVLRNFDTGSLSTIFPFTSAELSHHDGVLYGVNLHNNSLVLFDRFKMENANMVVFAKSGSGKSYAVKLEALRQLMLGTDIIVVDPENEYKSFAESVGGTFVSLSLSSSQKINPFDLPKINEAAGDQADQILRSAVTSVHGLVALMSGNLSPEEDSLLDKALYETYAMKDITSDAASHANEPPVLSDLVTVLSNMSGTESLVNRLQKYVEGSFSNLFNSQTNIDINNRVTVFSIRDMEDELRPLSMYLVLNFIWAKVKSELKKRFLVVDEAWVMMRFEDSARFLSAMIKRARKYYVGITIISQDVEDFLSSAYGHSVVNNSATQLLLGQSTSAIDKITETFKLTDGEKFFLTEAEVGQGLFFAGNNHAAIQIVASFNEDQVITTNPQQISERNAG